MSPSLRLAALCVALCIPASAVACFSSPEEQIVTPDALLAASKDVSLAKVIRAELRPDGRVAYTFEVARRFSGAPRARFQLDGSAATERSEETYDQHADPRFWTERGGRESNDPDCVIRPSFAVGGTYLVFLGQPFTRKSFERIVRTHGDANVRDKWLQRVEAHFPAPMAPPADARTAQLPFRFESLGCRDGTPDTATRVVPLTGAEQRTFLVKHLQGCGLEASAPRAEVNGDRLELDYTLTRPGEGVVMCECEYWARFDFDPALALPKRARFRGAEAPAP